MSFLGPLTPTLLARSPDGDRPVGNGAWSLLELAVSAKLGALSLVEIRTGVTGVVAARSGVLPTYKHKLKMIL